MTWAIKIFPDFNVQMMFFSYGSVVLLVLFVSGSDAGTRRLNRYIKHYEMLSYDKGELSEKHHRSKRSVTHPDSQVHFRFSAHNRDFHIRLKRDLSTFSDKLVIVGSSNIPFNSSHVDTSHIYTGHLIDEPGSVVFGSILDGVFDGKIVSPKSGAYYVEKSTRYFPSHRDPLEQPEFHSIVYHESDIDLSHIHDDESGQQAGCGATGEVRKWMEAIQRSAVEDDEELPNEKPKEKHKKAEALKDQKLNKKRGSVKVETSNKEAIVYDRNNMNTETPYDKYSKEMNTEGYTRTKRAILKQKDKNTCSLFIQTDPLIWKHVSEQVNNDPEKTREEILSLIAHHVTAVNYIYRDTKFDGKVEHRNIKFEVQRIKIDDDASCIYGFEQNPFCMENIDVSNFLNLHSLGNHEDFCLAYVFTYRDFTGGTLGLAWVASATGASGGICEKYKTYTETIGGMYQSTKRSLNTGIITFVNYNTRVPPKVSQLTLAHEIGHNFGSPHDYPLDCRPGGLMGNYIMFASATSGDRPNNSKFSSCSIKNISNVLDSIEDNKKRNCFKASEGAFCGNKIVEEGEECDCGYDDDECADKCCYPRIVSFNDRMMNQSARGCARRAFTECSPSQGPCCYSNTCKFIHKSKDFICRAETECSYKSTCNGTSSECPSPPPKPNKTRCNEGTQLCLGGECRGSICLEWGLNVCFLSSSTLPHADKRKLCELACMNGTDFNTCRSTSEFASAVGLPPGGISLRPGSPCDNFQGYCDVFFKCRPVDAEGPLARLKNIVFNRKTLQSVQQYAYENWWMCLIGGLIFLFIMAVFIKCCAVHTPSSNPKKPPARSLSDTLRRPISTLRRMKGHGNHHHGHRSGAGHSSRPHASRDVTSESINLANHDLPPPPYSYHNNQNYNHGHASHSSHHNVRHYPKKPSAPPEHKVIKAHKGHHKDRKSRRSEQYKV